jgi:hypothetical protein
LADRLRRGVTPARAAVAAVLPPPMLRPPGPTRGAQDVNVRFGGGSASVLVPAVDALRLLGRPCQAPVGHAARPGYPSRLGLSRPRALATRLIRHTRAGEVRRGPLPPPLEGLGPEELGQPRRDHCPLGRPLRPWLPGAGRPWRRRVPPPFTVEHHPFAVRVFPPRPPHQRLVKAREGVPAIAGEHPVVAPTAVPRDAHRLERGLPRPLSIRVRRARPLARRLQRRLDHRLSPPGCARRQA